MDSASNLIYELSLSPDIFEHANQNPNEVAYPLLILLQDVRKRGFISDLNAGDWKGKAARAIQNARGGDYTEEIYQLFLALEDEGRIIHHPDPASISRKRDWVEHALSLSGRSVRSPGVVVADPNLAEELEGAWSAKPLIVSNQWNEFRPESVEIKKSLNDYQIELQNLVGPSKRLRLVDPYFSCKKKYEDFLEICTMLVSEWLSGEDSEIHIHTSVLQQQERIEEEMLGSEEANKKLEDVKERWEGMVNPMKRGLEKEWVEIDVWLWRGSIRGADTEHHEMHDRYIFTEHNAVLTPWGLDCPNKTPTPRSRWSLLSKEAREELRFEFPRTEDNYKNRKNARKNNNDDSNSAFYDLVCHFSV
jgi:hypothetical protein